jgi:fructokinase
LKKEHCLLCLNYADKVPITHASQSIGGDAANVAVGCKKLGLKTAVVSELGDDVNGKIIKDGLKKAGVDTSMVKTLKKQETRYSVVLNYKAERTILSYHVERNYSLPKLPPADWIYYTSLGANFEKLQDNLVKYLSKHPQTKLAMNPGSYQIKNGLNKIKQILPKTDILFLNREEAERIVLSLRGTPTYVGVTKQSRRPNNKIAQLLQSICRLGPKTVVITDSYNGSYATDGKTNWFMPIYDVKAVGKTGAGDAYSSAFLSAIAMKKDIPTAMQWGTANSASVIQQIGAQKGLLDKAGVEKMIKKFATTTPLSL